MSNFYPCLIEISSQACNAQKTRVSSYKENRRSNLTQDHSNNTIITQLRLLTDFSTSVEINCVFLKKLMNNDE